METERFLLTLLAAMCLNELVHIAFEIWGARQKVQWLTARMDNKPHGDWPLHINTFGKTLILHLVMFMVVVGLCTVILLLLDLSIHNLLLLSVVSLILTYAYTTLSMDEFHSDIGALLKRFKRQ